MVLTNDSELISSVLSDMVLMLRGFAVPDWGKSVMAVSSMTRNDIDVFVFIGKLLLGI